MTVYSTLGLCRADLNGEPADLNPFVENGLNSYSTYLDLPPSGSTELRLQLQGRVGGDEYRLHVQPQPLVIGEEWKFGGALSEEGTPDGEQPFEFAVDLPEADHAAVRPPMVPRRTAVGFGHA